LIRLISITVAGAAPDSDQDELVAWSPPDFPFPRQRGWSYPHRRAPHAQRSL